jgi:4-hydroxythreonine-4-phosphate dehydrogenase
MLSLSFVKKSFQSDSVLHGIDKLDQIVRENQCFKCLEREESINFGVGDPKAGEYAIKSFVAATKALKDDLIDVLVTAYQ